MFIRNFLGLSPEVHSLYIVHLTVHSSVSSGGDWRRARRERRNSAWKTGEEWAGRNWRRVDR
jgi:hypothetical protein